MQREYNYPATTTFGGPKPHEVDHNKYGHFHEVPDRANLIRHYAFEEEAGRDLFVLDYAQWIVQGKKP